MLTAAESVDVPLRPYRAAPCEREERAEPPLSLVGLAGHAVRERPRAVVRGERSTVLVATHDATPPDLADQVPAPGTPDLRPPASDPVGRRVGFVVGGPRDGEIAEP
ncbi:ABC-transporter ATP binding protein [Streptomyces ambofaciens ATCC 23877]|uniref:ABC-transporter ATP binding protein n=1 Tax=Streptomyces ambofaciens (strain ATCC 23877 / 3486 / DSM 40053 / JCM 4204 / NBRC 12836 / NRRL B-2516) TaxID=278992 RepID=A0A0K2AZR9_STRA7|nr:ABC-transporter ATP binding protein [Streptomyces ambofaciens ATCC 23877]